MQRWAKTRLNNINDGDSLTQYILIVLYFIYQENGEGIN